MTIKPSPHIIEPPQKTRKEPKKKERKVTIFSPQQMYARPPKVTQILQMTQPMTKTQKAWILAQIMAQNPKLSYQKDVKPNLDAIKNARQAKNQKAITDAEEHKRKRNTQPFKVCEDYRDARDGGYTEEIQPYLKMPIPQLQRLLIQVKQYEPASLHKNVKGQVYAWLKNLILEKQSLQTQAEPEDAKSTLNKITSIFRGH